jgi:hypothetical protein
MTRPQFHVASLTPIQNGGGSGIVATVNSTVDVGERVRCCHSLANQRSSFHIVTSLGFTAVAPSILQAPQHGFSGLLLVPVVIYTEQKPVMNDHIFCL